MGAVVVEVPFCDPYTKVLSLVTATCPPESTLMGAVLVVPPSCDPCTKVLLSDNNVLTTTFPPSTIMGVLVPVGVPFSDP